MLVIWESWALKSLVDLQIWSKMTCNGRQKVALQVLSLECLFPFGKSPVASHWFGTAFHFSWQRLLVAPGLCVLLWFSCFFLLFVGTSNCTPIESCQDLERWCLMCLKIWVDFCGYLFSAFWKAYWTKFFGGSTFHACSHQRRVVESNQLWNL